MQWFQYDDIKHRLFFVMGFKIMAILINFKPTLRSYFHPYISHRVSIVHLQSYTNMFYGYITPYNTPSKLISTPVHFY